ncbi:MAG TPA: alpha/beta fold hydrolase [Solirubrobacteraceae bacterium]|jgi:pimeloyl-ACP methyl ester carboxylesterase
MARFVLVHGAFGGAWSWGEFVGELERAGHTVTAIDLPGSGDDTTPVEGVTLDACADRVCQALAAAPEPAILVGHSMGGVVITQAAARCPEQISLLVFVAAFMPRDGQSLIGLTQLPEGAGDQVQANIIVEGDPPVATMTSPEARASLMARCSPEQIARAVERARPQPVAPFATPVSIAPGSLDHLRRVYIHTTEDVALPPPLQRRMISENPCIEVVEIATDHAPFLSAQQETLAAFERFAQLAEAPAL